MKSTFPTFETLQNMRKTLFLLALIICSISAKAQVMSDSILIDNHYRIFYFNKPKSTSANGSLIFAMHGSGGTAIDFMKNAANLESKAATENFIIVYPQGYKKYWNECRKASTVAANLENIDEDTFFLRMIDYFKTKYKINDKHVFATGFSGGGQMAYRMAITLPDKFKAVSVMVANMPTVENLDCTESKKPVSIMIINGTADQTNPYNGGEMNAGVTLGTVRSTDQSFKYWASLGGYQGVAAKGTMPDADTSNDITVESYSYKKKNSPEVTLLKVINGKHAFPTDIDLFVETWTFFKRQL